MISTPTTKKAVRLLRRHGRNTLSWQILNPGMSLWFSHDDNAVIGYVLQGKMRIVGGAPVTDVGNLKRAAGEFENQARLCGQTVCYLAAETWLKEALETADRKAEHCAVILGAQPVWDPRLWEEIYAQKASLRELVSYSARRGTVVEEVLAEAVQNSEEHGRCRDEWLRGRKLPALGFLINLKIFENMSGRRFFCARRNGKLIGVASLAPIPGRNGWLIEHLFRAPGTLKGVSELLIDAVMRTLAKEGVSCVTLGLAPLSKQAGISYGTNPWWIRVLFSCLYAKGSIFYNFSGLDTFKSKFMPHRWEPVYAIVNKPRFGPTTLYRIAEAFLYNHCQEFIPKPFMKDGR